MQFENKMKLPQKAWMHYTVSLKKLKKQDLPERNFQTLNQNSVQEFSWTEMLKS